MPLALAATPDTGEPPLRLRLSHSLSLDRSAHTAANPLTAPLASVAALTEKSPFQLRWSETLRVAQRAPARDSVPEVAPLAQLAVPDEPEDDLPVGAPAPAVPGAPPGSRREASSKYGLAPIRWGGDVSYGYNRRKSNDADASSNHIYQLTTRASSYILYPWLARVNGGLTASLLRAGSAGDSGSSTGTFALTGNAGLNLFPLSRFPFSADFTVSDTRTDGSLVSSDYRTYRLDLRQDYRPARGRWRTNGAFNLSRLDGDFGTDTVYRLAGGYGWAADEQDLDAQGSYAVNQVDSGAQTSTLVGTASHSYRFDRETHLSTNATLAVVDSGAAGEGLADTTTSIFQVFSVGTWIPLDSPWSATASARLSRNESRFGDASFASTTAAALGSVSYRFSRNLSVSGNASVSGSPGGGSDSLTTSLSGTAFYSGDPLFFGNYSYNWGLSGGLATIRSQAGTTQSANVGGNHALNRSWLVSERASLGASLSQGLSTTRTSGENSLSRSTLSHSGSLSLSANPSDDSFGTIGLSLSDSRTFGDSPNTFQSVNLQVSGDWRLSQRSSISGNLTWQKALQSNEEQFGLFGEEITTVKTEGDDTTLNGSINYVHTRAFGFRGLIYSLSFAATNAQSAQRQLGDPTATRDGSSRSLDQRLNYRIGRLDTQLQYRVAELDGRKNALLFFRVSRSFGAF